MSDYEKISRVLAYEPESGAFFRKLHDWRPAHMQVDHRGYHRVSVMSRDRLAHRVAWLLHYGSWPDGELDHINGVKTDNRIENLRACSHPQNNHNQRKRRTNKSGHKNVCWMKSCSKWHVQVCLNGKIHHGGLFSDLDEAAAAAKALRIKLHGEFANHG